MHSKDKSITSKQDVWGEHHICCTVLPHALTPFEDFLFFFYGRPVHANLVAVCQVILLFIQIAWRTTTQIQMFGCARRATME